MFKFFRQHNKWLLAIVGSLTMIGFLVVGATTQNWFKDGQTDGKAVIGRLNDGRALHTSDLRTAQTDLEILKPLVPDPLLLTGSNGKEETKNDEADRWMLIQAEADRLGIDASEGEVASALKEMGIWGEEAANPNLRLALKDYLRAEALRQVTSGVAHELLPNTSGLATPGLQRLRLLLSAARAQQQARQMMQGGAGDSETLMQAIGLMNNARSALGALDGSQRLSAPLMAHQLQDLTANASGQLVVIPANTPTRLAQVAEPTEADLKTLFEPLKDSPRGATPYGFGYRLHARVRIEALGIPMDQVRKLTDDTATEEQVREWFDDHAADFAEKSNDPEKAPAPATLTAANREKARAQLRADLARNKALEIAHVCELALAGDVLAASANNNQLPAGTQPTALSVAAEAVKKKFGIAPILLTPAQIQAESVTALAADNAKAKKQPLLHTPGADAGWMTPQELAAHPALGSAVLVSQAGVSLPLVANHLAGGPEARALPESLQRKLGVNLPLPTVRDGQDTCWITRFVAASPARAAATLEEVKAQVIDDARELAAYRTLSSHTEALCGNAAATDGGLAKFSSDTDRLFAVPHLTRIDFSGQAASPSIPGVGASDALIKAVFDRTEQLRTQSGGVKGAALAARLVAVPVDSLRAVVLFELQDYSPIAQSRYRELAANPQGRFAVHTTTLAGQKNPNSPLTLESLQKRLGWAAAK